MSDQAVQSPCIGVCAMNEATGFCHGCYRTLDEISGWWDMDTEKQRQLIAQLEERQLTSVSFD